MIALKASFPFIPEIHLFHSRKKAERLIRKAMDRVPRFIDGAGAQTWCDKGIGVVFMSPALDSDWHADAALLAHEAVHVVLMHFAYLGEEDPNEEFVAYGVQVVSKALFEAHERWKGKRMEVTE